MSKSFSFYRFELCARYFHTDVTAFGMHWMQKVRQWMTYSFSPVTQCHPVFPSIACLPDTKWHFQATFKLSPVLQGSNIFILPGDPVSPCVTLCYPVWPSVAQCCPVSPCVTLCYLCHPLWPSIARIPDTFKLQGRDRWDAHLQARYIQAAWKLSFFGDFIIKIRSDLWLIDSFT